MQAWYLTSAKRPKCLHPGAVVKKPLSQQDIQILVDLFERIRPHQIYAAGDLSDPHGTHRVCLQVCAGTEFEVLLMSIQLAELMTDTHGIAFRLYIVRCTF